MNHGRLLAWAGLLLIVIAACWPGAEARGMDEPRVPTILAAPSMDALCGTDDRGRQVVWRLVAGTRPVLVIASVAACVYALGGMVFGIAAALWRRFGWLSARLVETALVVPVVFGLLLARSLFGAPSAWWLGVALGLLYGPHAARLCRAETERVLAMPFVEAARAAGTSPSRLLWRHVLPEAIRPVLAMATLALGQAALFEGALGAIGLGLAPPHASWGELLQQAAAQPRAWWLWAAPTIAIAMSVLTTQTLVRRDDDDSTRVS